MKNRLKTKKNFELKTIHYLIIYLFIYSFIGWLLETGYAFYETGEFVKRGFLYGPICPIYGWGGIILITFLNRFKNNSLKMFVVSVIVFSTLEYLVGFSLDAIFASKWWDYSDECFNLNGRISMLFSFVWGIFGIIFINHIHPFIEKKTKKYLDKIPKYITIYFIYSITAIYILDTLFSFIRYI